MVGYSETAMAERKLARFAAPPRSYAQYLTPPVHAASSPAASRPTLATAPHASNADNLHPPDYACTGRNRPCGPRSVNSCSPALPLRLSNPRPPLNRPRPRRSPPMKLAAPLARLALVPTCCAFPRLDPAYHPYLSCALGGFFLRLVQLLGNNGIQCRKLAKTPSPRARSRTCSARLIAARSAFDTGASA